MADVKSAIVGLCVLFLLSLSDCNSAETESIGYSRYTVESELPALNPLSSYLIQLRERRQVTGTEYKPVIETNTTLGLDHPLVQDNKKTTDVKTEPPGTSIDGGGSSSPTVAITKSATSSPAGNVGPTVNYTSPSSPPISLPSIPTVVHHDQPLLGVNGTGQKKDYNNSSTLKPSVVSEPINPTPKVTKLSTPKKAYSNDDLFDTDADKLIDSIDKSDNDTKLDIESHNITKFEVDYHLYYNSTIVISSEITQGFWDSFKNIGHNTMLSQSHRRAMTVRLSFDFPFYGHAVRNVTVATGGFLYLGEYVHSWLAATQYIAPLMANFDTSLSNDSFVKYSDNGTAFTVIWENVSLQDKPDVGTFTFSTTLHNTGDIVFSYFSVPIQIETIQDDKHPVKVGLSDAYIMDKLVFFARRKTIYEYHRVNFQSEDIQNSTIIYLHALPTCLSSTDCVSCLSDNPTFKCNWCPAISKCSTGTDRNRQDWMLKGCDRRLIDNTSMCPAIGDEGNNAAANSPDSDLDSNASNKGWPHDDVKHDSTVKALQNDAPVIKTFDGTKSESSREEDRESSNVGLVLGFMLPICLIMSALVWVLYAYRNPHTKSGQLLIQYRPSQWTWRRGEARYTAATIHM